MLIAVDKPTNISSFRALHQLKRTFPRGTKIGHSGTLDPMATWLLLIGTGQDTKRLMGLTGLSKTYLATIDLSQKTDTRDLEFWDYHEVLTHLTPPTRDEILVLLDSLIPESHLPLPPFSAKQKDGQRLYHLARNDKPVFEFRDMKIHSIDLLDYTRPEVKIRVDVGSGTYIRSIAYWLGEELKTWGILTALRRMSIGDYSLENIVCDQLVSQDIYYTVIEE